MGFRHVFHLIVIISIIVYAAKADSTRVLSDDFLFSDIGLSSSKEVLAFNQPDSSLDLFSLSSDVFDSPFEDTNNSDLFFVDSAGLDDTDNSDLFLVTNAGLDDESVEVADCSSSEAYPVIGKSRIRRRDASDVCTDPRTGPFKSQGLPSDAAGGQSHRKNLGIFSLTSVFSRAELKRRQNGVCNAVTIGSLPWGVCYQPIEVPLEPVGTSVVPADSGGTLFTSYIVDPGILSESKSGAKCGSI